MTQGVGGYAPTTGVGPGATMQAANGPAPGSSLMPSPTPAPLDAMASLYALLAEDNLGQSRAAKANVETRFAQRKEALEKQRAALEQARKAAEDKHGIFDSIGIAGLVGIVAANPIVVLADVSMHMAKVTPDFIKDFETENADKIELATKLMTAMSNAEVLEKGIFGNPQALSAALAIGGLIVQETGIFGKDASDWVGTGMMLEGSLGTGSGRLAATTIAADKQSAVADEIRAVDRATSAYTKYAVYAGMAVAAAGAVVATAGTASVVVVAIGIALSAAGIVGQETGCYDGLVGKDAARWLNMGLMVGGSVVTGVGGALGAGAAAAHTAQEVAAQAARLSAARAIGIGGNVLQGLGNVRQGEDQLQNAAISRNVDNANADAKEALHHAERMKRLIEDIIATVQDLKDTSRKLSSIVKQTEDTMAQTQLIAAGMRA